MEPRIETREETSLIGIRQHGTSGGEGTAALWRRFMPRREEINARVGSDLISMRVYLRSASEPLTQTTPFDEWAAVEVSHAEEVPAGMEPFTLPGGTYAVFIHRGPAVTFPRTAAHIFGTWLPRSGYELDTRPHFAVMPAGYRPDDPDAEEEIWIPVVEARSRHGAA